MAAAGKQITLHILKLKANRKKVASGVIFTAGRKNDAVNRGT